MRNVIYSNDVCAEYEAIQMNPEEYFYESKEEITDEAMWKKAYHQIELNLEDEQVNLNIDLPGNIILIGTLERWNGAYSVHKVLETNNIGESLTEAMQAFGGDNTFEIFVEDGKMMLNQWGHDNPTNPAVMEFRYLTKDYWDVDEHSTQTLISITAPIGDKVSEIYGWETEAAC